MDQERLEYLIQLMKENGIVEFELQEGDTHLRIVRGSLVKNSAAEHNIAVVEKEEGIQQQTVSSTSAESAKKIETEEEGYVKVESPIVGTFYRRPAPDADPFVEVGSTVQKGQTLCIVEAMKIMNEIESPVSGKIVKILPSDGHVVEYGEVLFLIDTKEA